MSIIVGLTCMVVLLVTYGLVKRFCGVEIPAGVITALALGVAVVVAAGTGAPGEVVGHLAPALEVLASKAGS